MQLLRQAVGPPGQPLDVAPHAPLQHPLPGQLLHLRHLAPHRDVPLVNVQDEEPRQAALADGRQVFPGDHRNAPGRVGRPDGGVRVQPSPVRAVTEGPAQGLGRGGHLPPLLDAGHRVVVVHQDRHVLQQESLLPDVEPSVPEAGRRVLSVKIPEVGKRQAGRCALMGSALPVEEKHKRRGNVRLHHEFPERRQEHGPQQRRGDLRLHHLQDPEGRGCRVLVGDPLEAFPAASVQPVGLQRLVHGNRHTFHANGPALVEEGQLPIDPPPAGMVVFRHPLGRHLAHLLDGPGQLPLGGAPRHDARIHAPGFPHPVHAVQVSGLHNGLLVQLLAVTAPSVNHDVQAGVHPVVRRQLLPGKGHKVAQGPGLVPGVLHNAPAGNPVAFHSPVEPLCLLHGRQPEWHRVWVKVPGCRHLPGQGVHGLRVPHQRHHVADVPLGRDLRAGLLDVHQPHAPRVVLHLQGHVQGVVLSSVAVLFRVAVRQDDHIRPRQPPGIPFPPFSGPAGVAGGGKAQPPEGFHIFLPLNDINRLPGFNGLEHLRHAVDGGVPDLRWHAVHKALPVHLQARVRLPHLRSRPHPLPEGLPGCPVQVVQPHHLKGLFPVLAFVAVHRVRMLPVRPEAFVLRRFPAGLSGFLRLAHGEPVILSSLPGPGLPSGSGCPASGFPGSGGSASGGLPAAGSPAPSGSAPGVLLPAPVRVRVHNQILGRDPQGPQDLCPRAAGMAAQIDPLLAILPAFLLGHAQAGRPVLVRRALCGVFPAAVRTAHPVQHPKQLPKIHQAVLLSPLSSRGLPRHISPDSLSQQGAIGAAFPHLNPDDYGSRSCVISPGSCAACCPSSPPWRSPGPSSAPPQWPAPAGSRSRFSGCSSIQPASQQVPKQTGCG